MTIIEGASMKSRTMADGSLRIEIEIDPRFAVAAFTLFSAPGTPVAIAALKTVAQAVAPPPAPAPEEPKGGPLAKLAGQWCGTAMFREWFSELVGAEINTAEEAAEFMRQWCGVDSRRRLDHDPKAAAIFDHQIRRPYAAHLQHSGFTA